MAYGRVRHSKKKAARAYYRQQGKHRVGDLRVQVVVNRSDPYHHDKTEAYGSRACLLRKKKGVIARCGDSVYGSTPTKAIKKALASLSKSLK